MPFILPFRWLGPTYFTLPYLHFMYFHSLLPQYIWAFVGALHFCYSVIALLPPMAVVAPPQSKSKTSSFWNRKCVLVGPYAKFDFQFWRETSSCAPHFAPHPSIPAPTPEEEERAFAEAWQYIRSSRPCAIYYYSKYERTIWRKLQQKYPHVATAEETEALFDPKESVDLYFDVVRSKTEWPTRDYSIKTLATFLGFSWRDTDPSGASSIEWYHRWVETGDDTIRQRILQYNEDDCIATRVLLDGIRSL